MNHIPVWTQHIFLGQSDSLHWCGSWNNCHIYLCTCCLYSDYAKLLFFFPLDPTVLKMTCAIEIVYNNNTIAYDSNICHMCERNISP